MIVTITNVRCYTSDQKNTLLATADLCLDDKVMIFGIKLIRRKDGSSFVSLPTRKSGSKYLAEARITDEELLKKVTADFRAAITS